jgi:hypothetical protein
MLVWKWIIVAVAFTHKHIKINFFYFLKIIFDISRWSENTKKYINLKQKKYLKH